MAFKGVDIGCRVTHSVSQSIADNTAVALALDSERYDTHGFHDNSVNNSRITIPTGQGGKYEFFASVVWAEGATGVRVAFIRKNGVTLVVADERMTVTTAGETAIQPLSTIVNAVAADYFELVVRHRQGAALNVQKINEYSPEFGCQRMGDS